MQSELLNAIVLGIVQGLAEFLPISSSGHVALFSHLIEQPMSLQGITLLHAGTLTATLILFRRDLWRLIRYLPELVRDFPRARKTDDGQLILSLLLSTAITAAIAFPLRHAADAVDSMPWLIGAFLVVSGVVVLSTKFSRDKSPQVSWRQALFIGCAQGVAVFPGLSRSGFTIASAMLSGVRGPEAFRYSFLLSVPVVIGALIIEAPVRDSGELMLGLSDWIGIVTAFASGFVGLLLVRRLVVRHELWTFAYYLIPVGVAVAFFSFPGN